jgi:hypothetical protein
MKILVLYIHKLTAPETDETEGNMNVNTRNSEFNPRLLLETHHLFVLYCLSFKYKHYWASKL